MHRALAKNERIENIVSLNVKSVVEAYLPTSPMRALGLGSEAAKKRCKNPVGVAESMTRNLRI